jgi:hypothetical protein
MPRTNRWRRDFPARPEGRLKSNWHPPAPAPSGAARSLLTRGAYSTLGELPPQSSPTRLIYLGPIEEGAAPASMLGCSEPSDGIKGSSKPRRGI